MKNLVFLIIFAVLGYMAYEKYVAPRPTPAPTPAPAPTPPPTPAPTSPPTSATPYPKVQSPLAKLEEALQRRRVELQQFEEQESGLVALIEKEKPNRFSPSSPSLAEQQAIKMLSEVRGRIAHARAMLQKQSVELQRLQDQND